MNSTGPSVYQIAGVQMDVALGDIPGNTESLVKHLDELADPIDLVIFPECALSGYCFEDLDSARAAAVGRDDPAWTAIIDACRRRRTTAVVGFLERAGEAVYNSAAWVGPDGWIAAYRKTHLPTLGVDRFTRPGNEPYQVVEYRGLRVGLLICYDSSFPEASRVLTLHGADLIVLPTNWPTTSGCTADFVPNCRALENHVYFAAINRIGVERGVEFIGKSRICAPGGRDLVAAPHDQPAVLRAAIEPAVARQKRLILVPGRHEVDRISDRRPELYRPICEPR